MSETYTVTGWVTDVRKTGKAWTIIGPRQSPRGEGQGGVSPAT